MIETTHIALPGGRFTYLAQGDAGAPLVLCLHGFPDHPPSFAPLMEALTGAGYRAVAPYMRGYAPSTLAGPFHVDRLALDIIELADALSPGRACGLVGHDWGAAATYVALARAPQRFRAAVTMAVPHPQALLRALATNRRQRRRSWYMALFQLPRLPEHIVARDDFAFIERLWRDWSPGYEPHEPAMTVLKHTLAASMPAPLEYYRALTRPLRDALARARRHEPPIRVPTLHLQGADDGCIGPETAASQSQHFTAPFHTEIIPNAGHFLHLEAPNPVNALILSHL